MRRITGKNLWIIALCVIAAKSAPIAAQADVIDLEKGEFSNTTRSPSQFVSGVLDLDRPTPQPAAQLLDQSDPVILPSVSAPRQGSAEVEEMIRNVAAQYLDHPGLTAAELSGLQWLALFRANIGIESNFRQSAVSHVGAIGLGQLMPETARVLRVDPHDAEENLHGSARYLLAQMLRFQSAELALAAYNAGPEAVIRYGGIPPYRETQEHVVKVFALYRATIPQENL